MFCLMQTPSKIYYHNIFDLMDGRLIYPDIEDIESPVVVSEYVHISFFFKETKIAVLIEPI